MNIVEHKEKELNININKDLIRESCQRAVGESIDYKDMLPCLMLLMFK